MPDAAHGQRGQAGVGRFVGVLVRVLFKVLVLHIDDLCGVWEWRPLVSGDRESTAEQGGTPVVGAMLIAGAGGGCVL